jgi:hypothetical protein
MFFSFSFISNANIDSFQSALKEYSNIAKTESKKRLSLESVDNLSKLVMNIINYLKNIYLDEKLGVKKIILKYNNVPELNEDDSVSNYDKQFIKFIFATYNVFTNLTPERVSQIVRKSPLEFVSILKEIETFLEFVSADTKKYGNAIIIERPDDETAIIYASTQSIAKIAQHIIIKNLISTSCGNVYPVSRIVSHFCSNFPKQVNGEVFDSFINSLKRNTRDSNRIQLRSQIRFNDSEPPTSEFSKKMEAYLINIEQYLRQEDEAQKQEVFKLALANAKSLIGIKDGYKVKISDKIESFCSKLEKLCAKLQDKLNSDDKKTKLKAARDIENYTEILKFLQVTTQIFESFYATSSLLEKIIVKDPYSIMQITREMLTLLGVLRIILKTPNNLVDVVKKLKELSYTSDDGTYLLSALASAAITTENFNISNVINNLDLSKNRFLNFR